MAGIAAWHWSVLGLGVTLAVYATFVVALVVAGRRSDARALSTFVPDCVGLFRALIGDRRVPGWRKVLLATPIAYLAMPFDLVPDFMPVAGQLDDAIVVALVLRSTLRASGPELLRVHWPGPDRSLDILSRFAFGQAGQDR